MKEVEARQRFTGLYLTGHTGSTSIHVSEYAIRSELRSQLT